MKGTGNKCGDTGDKGDAKHWWGDTRDASEYTGDRGGNGNRFGDRGNGWGTLRMGAHMGVTPHPTDPGTQS